MGRADVSGLERVAKLMEQSKTWLITGVAGFIGSNLLEALLLKNQRVIGLDNFATGSHRNLEEVKTSVGNVGWSRFHFMEGDICNAETCFTACKGVDYVLHQAALGSVPRSLKDPLQTHRVNIDGFLNMLIAARDSHVQRFVYASSSAIYGDHPDLPKVEDKVGKPLSPYALTKYVNELYADLFSRTYGLPTIGLRYFNVFGRRQDPDGPYAAVIPKWIRLLLRHEICIINGDGTTSRDFCYIDNVIQANILACLITDQITCNQVFNIASGGSMALRELYDAIRNLLASKLPHLAGKEPVYASSRPGDIQHSQADIARAMQLLKYTPSYSIREGLEATVNWYLSYPNRVRS